VRALVFVPRGAIPALVDTCCWLRARTGYPGVARRRGYLSKAARVDDVVRAIDAITRFEAMFSPSSHHRWTLRLHVGWVAGDQVCLGARGLRGQGHGRQSVEAAEGESRVRCCELVWLESSTFQAPIFYQRLGYQSRFSAHCKAIPRQMTGCF